MHNKEANMLSMLITAREGDLGNGLKVRRVLPYARRRMVGPFAFFDHAGPVSLPPEAVRAADVRPHPHIGLSTFSYLLGGEIIHRDSLGVVQRIRPGEVNWMTAGRGISHSERFEHPVSFAGGGLELMQFWIALPEADEECDPAFTHYGSEALPLIERPGLCCRVLAGEVMGQRSAVHTSSPLFCAHVSLSADTRFALDGVYPEQAVYVARGAVSHGGQTAVPGQMMVFDQGTDELLAEQDSVLMVFGGEPVGPRHIFWNFVSSRPERIEQAKADWRAGRFALPPDDHDEFIPLPG
jgi:redox-sensitive bicupin YhaK (pirin superfamily)